MRYRTDRHNPALVYHRELPGDREDLVAVFVAQDGEHELDALHYARAMNATMPCCTCRVICCCGALVGTTSGCETCMEHNGECIGDLGDLLDQLIDSASVNDFESPDEGVPVLRDAIMQHFGWLGRYAS